MRTHDADPNVSAANSGGVGNAAKQVAEHASSLAKLEFELATLELKGKIAALGTGAAFGLAAIVIGLYAIGFGFATIAAGLAEYFPTWLSLLAVTVFLLVVALGLLFLAVQALKRGSPPVPRQAIQEAKETSEALKADG